MAEPAAARKGARKADRLAAIAAEEARIAAERAAKEAAERQAADDLAQKQRALDEERAAFERERAEARQAEEDRKNAAARAALGTMQIATRAATERVETITPSGAKLIQWVGGSASADERASQEEDEPAKPPVTEQTDAFEAERQVEAARAAALPKPATARPDDSRLTAAIAKAFDVEPAIAAEWLGTYDAFEEIARLQGVPA
mgnify:FL=1